MTCFCWHWRYKITEPWHRQPAACSVWYAVQSRPVHRRVFLCGLPKAACHFAPSFLRSRITYTAVSQEILQVIAEREVDWVVVDDECTI